MGSAVVFAIAAAVAIIGWRGVRRQHARVVEALKQAEAALKRDRPITLEKDPQTGVYRPKR
jgi:hypothetical protein